MKIKLDDGQEIFIPKGEGNYKLREGRRLKATVNIQVVSEDEDGCTVEIKAITLPDRPSMESADNSGDRFANFVRDNSNNRNSRDNDDEGSY